jgi:adenylate cyclase
MLNCPVGKHGVPDQTPVQRRLAAILAADVVGYSKLIGEDEAGTLAALREIRKGIVNPVLAEHGGRVFKVMGDGLLAEFPSAVQALRAAIGIQEAMRQRNAGSSSGPAIDVRIGVHQGDVVIEGTDLLGDGINIAARLEGLAEPGGICISGRVHEDAAGKIALDAQDIGDQSLKNIARRVRAYRVSVGHSPKPDALGTKPALPLPDKPSISVLPFQNMSGDPEQEYFADGIAEEIITALSRVKGFFVIARNSSFTYKGQSVDVKRVGRELGVRYVLEGSVRRSGNKLRIAAQLIDAQSNAHVWSDRYDGELGEVFDLQDRITESVVGALEPTIRSAEIERARRKRPESLDAYDLVMRSLPSLWANTRETNIEAVALLEKAINLDPGYAFATALCAWSHAMRAPYYWTNDPEQELDIALCLAKRAASLDSEDPFVLAILSTAYTFSQQVLEAVPLIERSLAIDPNSAFAWQRNGWLRIFLCETDKAISSFERAIRISPLDPYNFNAMIGTGYAHLFAERFEEGLEWVTKGIATRPSATWAWRAVALAYVGLGRMDDAKEAIAKFLAANPGMTVSRVAKTLLSPNLALRQWHLDGLRKAGLPE